MTEKVRVGSWVLMNTGIVTPQIPMLVTHVWDDGSVSGVALSGERASHGWRTAVMDYRRVSRGQMPRQWQPYPEGEGPGAGALSPEVVSDAVKAAVGAALAQAEERIASVEAFLERTFPEGGTPGQTSGVDIGTVREIAKNAADEAVAGIQTGTGMSAEDIATLVDRRIAEARIENRIRDAIGRLDPKNPEHFTTGRDPKPRVEAIEAILGTDITAGQRDATWAAVQNT